MSDKMLVSKKTHNNLTRELEKAEAKVAEAVAIRDRKKTALQSVELEPQRGAKTTPAVQA